MGTTTSALVVDLRDCDRDALALAGGKGANLGELIRAGAPVPPGFVVTTEAYAVAAASPPRAKVGQMAGRAPGNGWGVATVDPTAAPSPDGGSADTRARGDRLRAQLLTADIPDPVEQQVREAYERLGGTVAVRSSATAEDLPGAAFAGQQDTFLGITGVDAVLDAIRRCWASLWNERAVAYRARLGIDDAQVRIAVVVQRLVDSDVAGVMFTANPVTGGRDEYVVDASPGLGEAVVSGRVTPDHYLTDPDGRIHQWTPGRREVVITSTGAGTAETTAGADDTGDPQGPVLPAAVVAELCRHAGAVAHHFGRPQDIEWAWAEGRLWLVQARPMTALPPPPQTLNPVQRWIAAILLDFLTHRPYPIDVSTWVPRGPVGMMSQVAADIGIRGLFDGILPETDGVVDRVVIPMPRPTLRLLGAPLRSMLRARRRDPAHWREDPRWQGMGMLIAHLDAVEVAALSWSELVRMPARAMAALGPVTDLRIDYLPGTGLAVLRLAAVTRLLGRSRLLGDLVHGAPTETSAMNDALAELARIAREDPALTAAVETDDLAAARAHPQFGPAFESWLERFGHRETETMVLITQPTLAEAPTTVLGLVKVLLTERASDTAPSRSGSTDVAAGSEPLATLLEHPLLRADRTRRWITNLVTKARAGIAFREDSHVAASRPMPALRRSIAEIGRRLADAGVLDGPQDVMHCRLDELEALPDPAVEPAAGERLRQLVTARRAARDELAGVPLIMIASSRTGPRGDELAVGVPASSGTATGPVRVVRGPAEFGQLRSGDVLVCPYTNPSWTPLFQRAAAVVVDSGGPASHAAIVAREYGIPAVMGTRDGTSTLVDGDPVVVDGSAGTVRAEEPGDGHR